MITAAVIVAAASVIASGAFWPTLKVNFEQAFAKRFLIPVFVLAVLNCFILAQALGWWTVLAHPALMLAGSLAISPLTSGRHLRLIVFDGGIWVVGIASIVLCAVAFII